LSGGEKRVRNAVVNETAPTQATPAAATAKASGPSFALALGGGGARGLAHIHVLEALDDLGIRPTTIAGSSIGAIIGAAYAAGMSGAEIREFAVHTLGRGAEVAGRMWRARPHSFAEMLEGGVRFGQFNVERILRSFLPDTLPTRFEDLGIPLKVTATDYFAHELVILDSGELVFALAASSALPAVFLPLRRNGRLFIDGGYCDPVPFDLVMDDADMVIAVDVVGAPLAGPQKIPSSIDLTLGANQIMMQSIIALKLKECRPAILLRPPVSGFGVLDFLKIGKVLAETQSIRDETKRAVEAAIMRYEGEVV
jgi:NTE family protein